MGSSKYLDLDYEIYGIENFKKQILQDNYKNVEDLLDGETHYILKYNTLSPNGYNRFLPNKNRGFHTGGCHYTRSEKTKEKIAYSKKGEKNPSWGKHPSEKTRQQMSNAHMGEKNHRWGKELTEEHKLALFNSRNGVSLSEETKELMRKPKTEEHKKHMRKPKSKEAKTHMSESKRGTTPWNKGKKFINGHYT
jgi:hypothetical protein